MFFQLKIRQCAFLFIVLVGMISNRVQADPMSDSQISVGDTARFITWTYKETPMGLYVPASTDKPLPIVMFLHGCNNSPVYPSLWIISALNAIEPCAVFLPTAPETQNTEYPCADWGGTYDSKIRPQMTNALHELDSVIALYGFDSGRQYLYGESMGGEGVFRLLVDFPTRFAGAVVVAGYTLDKGADHMAQTPLWILHGANDEISPVDNSQAIYNSIVNSGGTTTKFTKYPDLGHVPGIERARTEPGLLEWLLALQCSNSILPRIGLRGSTTRQIDLFAYMAGTLYFTSPLPVGAVVVLFDLNGKILHRKNTRSTTSSVRFPTGTESRIALWHISHPLCSESGKFLLCQQ